MEGCSREELEGKPFRRKIEGREKKRLEEFQLRTEKERLFHWVANNY